jgi:hypothetical protein
VTQERGAMVRPAGAPMVPMPPPSGPGRAEGLAGQALEKAKAVRGEVTQAARGRAEREFDRRSAEAADRVSGTAADVRDVAEELRKKGKEGPARLAEQAADRIERIGSYLREADLDRIGSDFGRLSRSRPAVVVAGAAAVGLVAGRILKASSGNGNRATDGASGQGR